MHQSDTTRRVQDYRPLPMPVHRIHLVCNHSTLSWLYKLYLRLWLPQLMEILLTLRKSNLHTNIPEAPISHVVIRT